VERTLTLLASAVATLGHLLFALAAGRSGHAVPRAFARVAFALAAWSGALFLHDLFAPQVGSEIAWIASLALLPVGLDLAATMRGDAPRLARAARFAWWIAAAGAAPLAFWGERALPIATALLFPGLVAVLVALAQACRARGVPARPFLIAAALAIAAALVDAVGLLEGSHRLPRLAGIGSVAIVALLGFAVARHGLFELRPLLGRAAALALVALAAALPLALALDRVAKLPAQVVVAWLALLTLALLAGPLVRALRSPAARARERRRREVLAQLEGIDVVLARATTRDELAKELAAALQREGGEIVALELTPPQPRPQRAAGGPIVLPLRVGKGSQGWIALELRDPRLLEARVLRRALRRLAARVAVALRAIAAQEARRRAERLASLGAMAAGIAHEIKNPLGAILGALELLEGTPAMREPDSARWFAILRDEARRLDRVTTDALALGKEPRLERREVAPRAIAEAALLLAEGRAKAAGVALSLAGGDGGVPRLVDGDQLRHALLNLLLNSISVQPGGGRVGVAVVDDGARVTWHVRDDGPGIPAGQRARLFEPFFTTRPTGSGLGLAVAHRVAAAHGGSLSLREPDGGYRGAHFVLTVPAATGADG